ncbi:MAG: hypothetical protein ACE5FJ_00660 [Gemmatimonadales bacterium]
MPESDDKRPPLLDAVGRLCKQGKDVADYLFQVPDDEAQRTRLREILDQIQADKSMANRKELPKLVGDLRALLDEPPSMMGAEQLQVGFDRMFKLWAAARSGLF